MMFRKPYLYLPSLVVLSVLALHASAMAALEWDTQRISKTASVEDEQAEYEFTFTNTGKVPVTITSTRGSCGCTTAKLEKKTYEAGESGKIKATFTFGDRAGKQRKRITVYTKEDAPDSKPISESIALEMRVNIPQPVIIRPRLVYWRPGDTLEPKIVQILIDHDKPVDIEVGKVEGDSITAQIKSIEGGKQYELTLTPVGSEPHVDSYPVNEQTRVSDNQTRSIPAEAASTHLPDDKLISTKQGPLAQTTPPPGEARAVIFLNAKFGEQYTRSYKIIARIMIAPGADNSSTQTTENSGASLDTKSAGTE